MTSIWQIAAIQIGNFSAFFGLQSAIKGHPNYLNVGYLKTSQAGV